MPIAIACPSCGHNGKAPDHCAGQTIRCPKCKSKFKADANKPAVRDNDATVAMEPGAYEFPIIPQSPPEIRPPEPPLSSALTDLPPKEAQRIPCPLCSELILPTAKKCKHCGETLDPFLRATEEAKRVDAQRQPLFHSVQPVAGQTNAPLTRQGSWFGRGAGLGCGFAGGLTLFSVAVAGAFFVLVILFFVLCCGGVSSVGSRSTSTFKVPNTQLDPLSQKKWVVQIRDGSAVPLAISREAGDRFQRLTAAGDADGISQMMRSGLIFEVPSGTEVLIIGGGLVRSEVRIKEGNHQGKSGWIPNEWLEQQ